MLDQTEFNKIYEICTSQQELVDSILTVSRNAGFNDPADYFGELFETNYELRDLIAASFREQGLEIEKSLSFIFFKFPQSQSPIKLHIPLDDFMKDGILVANIITQKIPNIAGLKLAFPLYFDTLDELSASVTRMITQVPITIYLPLPNRKDIKFIPLTKDNLLSHNIEEITFIIHRIDSLLNQISNMQVDTGNIYDRIGLSQNIAETDIQIATYTTLTIEDDNKGNYISASKRYREAEPGSGVYIRVEEGETDTDSLSGAEVRQRLLQNSSEVRYLQQVLPYIDIFHELHEYMNLANQQELEGATAGLLLQAMRDVVKENISINEFNNLREEHIENNDILLDIKTKFHEKYQELNSESVRPGL